MKSRCCSRIARNSRDNPRIPASCAVAASPSILCCCRFSKYPVLLPLSKYPLLLPLLQVSVLLPLSKYPCCCRFSKYPVCCRFSKLSVLCRFSKYPVACFRSHKYPVLFPLLQVSWLLPLLKYPAVAVPPPRQWRAEWRLRGTAHLEQIASGLHFIEHIIQDRQGSVYIHCKLADRGVPTSRPHISRQGGEKSEEGLAQLKSNDLKFGLAREGVRSLEDYYTKAIGKGKS
ncbi:hypothetical protein BV898_02168 [Hypsibius exemplaris]|uniref:Uncharacterized protein n=1 Tax=Hypsibius exemplaris TaxID=2072580 RepID=A0A1W0X8E5_HYPEX|nr:hypothetical protein BV898_02168 [Hypsibius exemplaris]